MSLTRGTTALLSITALLGTACAKLPEPLLQAGAALGDAASTVTDAAVDAGTGLYEDGRAIAAEMEETARITAIQEALVENGCLVKGNVDGKPGPTTDKAVSFQNAANDRSDTIDTITPTIIEKSPVCADTAGTPKPTSSLDGGDATYKLTSVQRAPAPVAFA